MSRSLLRASVLVGLSTIAVAISCGKSNEDRGGLMLLISQDGTLTLDRLDVKISTTGERTLLDNTYRVPEETPLPTTVAIVSNGDPTAAALIRVSGWLKETPLDVRDAIVRQVPNNRVAALRVVLSGRCKNLVTEVDGQAVTTCGDGSGDQTCDPETGECTSSEVDAGDLESFEPGMKGAGGSGGGGSGGNAGAGGDGGSSGSGSCDCAATQACLGGTCVERECTPSARFCSGSSVRECDDAGVASMEVDVCGSGTYCDPGSGSCEAGTCAPDEPACDGDRATICNDDGTDYVDGGMTCDAGTTCNAGACVEQVCAPDQAFCQGDQVRRCAPNGLASSVERSCEATEYCDNRTAACRPRVCTNGQYRCTGQTLEVCAANGSAFEEVRTCADDERCDQQGETCTAGACPMNFGDCNSEPGCETELGTTSDCRGCGDACLAVNGANSCTETGCEPQCDTDHEDCNGNPNDGCESLNTLTDCGACNSPCVRPHASAACVNGSCTLGTCEDGYEDCDTNQQNGCETPLGTSSDCAGCDDACTNDHGVNLCVSGQCVPNCATGWGNCDGNERNGCEEPVTTLTHCGDCDTPCDLPNASETCVSLTCEVLSCELPFSDCNDEPGCETRLDTPTDCGGCALACGTAAPHCVATGSTPRCQAQPTVVNDVDGSIVGNTLTMMHTLQTGTNRLILLAVASESPGNGIVGARPDSVTYGGTAMTAGPEQPGVNGGTCTSGGYDFYGSDHFVYYLNEAGIGSKSGPQVVSISGASAPSPTTLIANLVQVDGVRQTNPISASNGGFLGTCASPDPPDPSSIGTAVSVATTGSRIYAFASAIWPATTAPSFSVTPSSGLSSVDLFASGVVLGGGTEMRAFFRFVNASSPSAPSPGSYTPTFSIAYTGRVTGSAVVIHPGP